MFNKKFISHLEEEIKFLREQNKRLQNMIIALKGKSIEYNNIIANSDEIKDPLKELELELDKLKAETPQEIREKELAQQQLKELYIT